MRYHESDNNTCYTKDTRSESVIHLTTIYSFENNWIYWHQVSRFTVACSLTFHTTQSYYIQTIIHDTMNIIYVGCIYVLFRIDWLVNVTKWWNDSTDVCIYTYHPMVIEDPILMDVCSTFDFVLQIVFLFSFFLLDKRNTFKENQWPLTSYNFEII